LTFSVCACVLGFVVYRLIFDINETVQLYRGGFSFYHNYIFIVKIGRKEKVELEEFKEFVKETADNFLVCVTKFVNNKALFFYN